MTAITLTSSAAGRVGQLVRLLASDKSGEVVAAASALKRTLGAAGLDMHAFAGIAEKALAPPLAPPDVDGPDVRLIIKFCLDYGDELTDREWQFVNDLDRLARRLGRRLELTAKQEAWLVSISERLRGMR